MYPGEGHCSKGGFLKMKWKPRGAPPRHFDHQPPARLHGGALLLEKGGQVWRAAAESLGAMPATVFPEGEITKARVLTGGRGKDPSCVISGAIELHGYRSAAGVISLHSAPAGLGPRAAATPTMQTKGDVWGQFGNARPQAPGGINWGGHDPAQLLTSIANTHRGRESGPPIQGGVIPLMAVRGFATAYWLAGIDQSGMCGPGAFNPRQQAWGVFQSCACNMGSKASVLPWLRVAGLVVSVMRGPGAVCLCYIGGALIFAHGPEMLGPCAGLCGGLCATFGLALSNKPKANQGPAPTAGPPTGRPVNFLGGAFAPSYEGGPSRKVRGAKRPCRHRHPTGHHPERARGVPCRPSGAGEDRRGGAVYSRHPAHTCWRRIYPANLPMGR